jgi:hypothetical protein
LPVREERKFPDALASHPAERPRLWANVLRLAVDELLCPPERAPKAWKSLYTADRTPDAWEVLSRCCEPYRLRGEAAEAAVIALGVAEEAGLFGALPDRRLRADYEDPLPRVGSSQICRSPVGQALLA